MPELPEVETTLRGISPYLAGQTVESVVIRQPALRWPVPRHLPRSLAGRTVQRLTRRGKYILVQFDNGTLLLHLGMSGSLRIVARGAEPRKHDHVDIILSSGQCLRLHDPRRFGAVLWSRADPMQHKLLKALGPEPLSDQFSGALLHRLSRGRKVAVKNYIMDSHIVVGVGNIYANEALFAAGILPSRAAGRISLQRYKQLAVCIQQVLSAAIQQGGTTLRDFVNSEGQPGYFKQQLAVYDRTGQECRQCKAPIRTRLIGQRSSFFCPNCQK